MRILRRVPVLAVLAIVAVACSSGSTTSAAPGGSTAAATPAPAATSAPATPEASAPASESAPPAAVATPEPAKDCARTSDEPRCRCGSARAATRAWSTSSSATGTRPTRTKPINLSYIPHAEMVGKIAQGIATGDVPDLMGMDLIYAPQFENAGQLVDITDKIKDWPELKTASPGHMTVATFNDRLYGVPLYADVSALFYNKDLYKKAGLDPDKPPTSLAELRDIRGQDHRARRRRQGLLPARQLRRLQHLHGRPAHVGLGRHDHRGRQVRRRAARRATVSRRCSSGRATWSRPATSTTATAQETGETVPPPVRLGQRRQDGHRQLQHHPRQRPDEGPPVRRSASRTCPATIPARRLRSSAATSWSSRTAATGSTTRSRS